MLTYEKPFERITVQPSRYSGFFSTCFEGDGYETFCRRGSVTVPRRILRGFKKILPSVCGQGPARGSRQFAIRLPSPLAVCTCRSIKLRGKSAALRLRPTVNTGCFFLRVFHDFRPNKRGEPLRTQHPTDDLCGDPGALVLGREDRPGRAPRQSEHLGLCVKRNKSGSDQRFANLADLGRLSCLHICE